MCNIKKDKTPLHVVSFWRNAHFPLISTELCVLHRAQPNAQKVVISCIQKWPEEGRNST